MNWCLQITDHLSSHNIRRAFVKYRKLQSLLRCYCAGLRLMLFGCFNSRLKTYEADLIKGREPPEKLCAFEFDFVSFNSLYRLIFLGCSIAALGTSGYFYCGCLLYIFMSNNVMLVVLAAVYHSGKTYNHSLSIPTPTASLDEFFVCSTASQLFSVFILIFMVLFIYAVISFVFLHEFFVTDNGQFCRTLGECVVTVVRDGLLDTLGLVR